MLVIVVPVSVVHSMKRRSLRKRAERMGVDLGVSDSKGGVSGMDIEACGYCVMFLVAVILGALGVSLPIILPQSAFNLIMAVICVVFGALFWGLAVAVIPYSVRDLRRLNRALEAAVTGKTGGVSQMTPADQSEPVAPRKCGSCGRAVRGDERFCRHCGAAIAKE